MKLIVCLLLCLCITFAAETVKSKPVAVDWNRDGIIDTWGHDWNNDGWLDYAAPVMAAPVASWGAPAWRDRVVEPMLAAPTTLGWRAPTAWGTTGFHDGETITVREVPAGEYTETDWATVQTLGPVAEPAVQPNYVDVPVTLPTVHVGDMPAPVVAPMMAAPMVEPWGVYGAEPWAHAPVVGGPHWI